MRGFGPSEQSDRSVSTRRRAAANPAVNKAAGKNQPVTQEIAMTVKGDKVSCSINKKVVATYDKSSLVTAGKLKSTDGVYGIRFAHNTDATVTGLAARQVGERFRGASRDRGAPFSSCRFGPGATAD